MVKRVLIGLQAIEEPKEDAFPTKEETTLIATPLPPFKLGKCDICMGSFDVWELICKE